MQLQHRQRIQQLVRWDVEKCLADRNSMNKMPKWKPIWAFEQTQTSIKSRWLKNILRLCLWFDNSACFDQGLECDHTTPRKLVWLDLQSQNLLFDDRSNLKAILTTSSCIPWGLTSSLIPCVWTSLFRITSSWVTARRCWTKSVKQFSYSYSSRFTQDEKRNLTCWK